MSVTCDRSVVFSSTNQDIAEILMKVALGTINQPTNHALLIPISQGTPVSSTNTTETRYIAEIFIESGAKHHNLTNKPTNYTLFVPIFLSLREGKVEGASEEI